VDKILQDANVKLSSALSDIFGVSGQLMLEALREGKAQPAEIAQFAQRRAQRKIPQIIAVLEGHRMSDHHRQMIRYSLEHLRFLEEHILELDEQIVPKIEALCYTPQWQLLQTVPGIKENSAASVLAEIGPDMGQFGSEKNLSSNALIGAIGASGRLALFADERRLVTERNDGGKRICGFRNWTVDLESDRSRWTPASSYFVRQCLALQERIEAVALQNTPERALLAFTPSRVAGHPTSGRRDAHRFTHAPDDCGLRGQIAA
jgi:hypothetical protein